METTRMLKIAMDFHNVLADLTETWTNLANQSYGYNIKPEDVTDWKNWECTAITKDQFWSLMAHINGGGLTPEIPIIKGVTDHFPSLYYSYPLEVLTAVPEGVEVDIKNWFSTHRLPAPKINCVGTKKQGETKFDYPFDIYVDDNPWMAENCPESKFVILFDQPWNRKVKVDEKNVWRAYGWNDVLQLCHILQKVY